MSKRSLYVIGIVLTAILGALLNWMFCCPSGGKTTTNSVLLKQTTTPIPTSYGFIINDNSKFNYNSNDNFNFEKNNSSILKPLAPNVDDGVLKLKTYLETNPNKTIDVTGLYTSTEKNTSTYENLGLARAHAVKTHLVSKGLTSKQINVFGKLDDTMVLNKSNYLGPVKFEVKTIDPDNQDKEKATEKLETLYRKIITDPIELHFESNSSSINLTNKQRQELLDITKYLDHVANAKILVVGHTDNVGNPENNVKLGLERANTVKNYLITKQFSANKIEILSYGEKRSVASNSTEIGRARNRRVIITLKKTN